MSIGILSNVNFIKLNRDAKQGTCVCSRTTRLAKSAVAIVKTVPQLGCLSQDAESSGLPKHVKYRGNPGRKVLGSIRRVRFTQSAPRQASIREEKGKSPGKIQVKLPHQRSPYAMKLESRSHEETDRQRAMRPRQSMEPCQKYLQAQRKGQSYILFACR